MSSQDAFGRTQPLVTKRWAFSVAGKTTKRRWTRSGAQLATSPLCLTEIVEAAFAYGRRRPHVESEDDYCFGAGTVDALKGGGVFLSFASWPNRYLKGTSST